MEMKTFVQIVANRRQVVTGNDGLSFKTTGENGLFLCMVLQGKPSQQ